LHSPEARRQGSPRPPAHGATRGGVRLLRSGSRVSGGSSPGRLGRARAEHRDRRSRDGRRAPRDAAGPSLLHDPKRRFGLGRPAEPRDHQYPCRPPIPDSRGLGRNGAPDRLVGLEDVSRVLRRAVPVLAEERPLLRRSRAGHRTPEGARHDSRAQPSAPVGHAVAAQERSSGSERSRATSASTSRPVRGTSPPTRSTPASTRRATTWSRTCSRPSPSRRRRWSTASAGRTAPIPIATR